MTTPAPNALDHIGPLFRRILLQGAILAVGLAVVGGVVGWFVADAPGLVGGLVGAVMSVVFLSLTAASILLGYRASGGQMISGAFFGIVMGTWFLKFVLFIVVLVVLKDRPWVDAPVMAVAIIVGVVGSLVIDVVAVSRARIPIGVSLPGDVSAPVVRGAGDASVPVVRGAGDASAPVVRGAADSLEGRGASAAPTHRTDGVPPVRAAGDDTATDVGQPPA
ncbi:hypothetical protein [Curtobacterium sp. Leaf261]|uniref:hypothetical protein n=1 Tax=Curtobacterium sp. Leaf261 TaxID=1736311 RepID=UPI0006FFE068|nr:hypothetical protein [Curtobacterium sp. Leaf261]KQO64682.1 hypothetical protein ASF23_00255 [Curtobacterium sp. Leaf261]